MPALAHSAEIQARGLARMKLFALGLLALAAVLYAVSTALQPRHPAWAWAAAFSEAAMVGAMADWFAVVALFRHPLGLPIPHTAIIPNNKERIGQNLAAFICEHFLSNAQVLDKLQRFDPAGTVARWLAQPDNAHKLAEHLTAAARYGLRALDDERVRHFIRSTVLARLERVDVSRLAGRWLDVLTADRRHQAVLDEVLKQVAGLLEDEGVKAKIVEVIAAEMKLLRLVGLDTYAAKMATEKIVASVGRIVGEMGADDAHPLRLRFDTFMQDFIARLKDDPELRLRGEAIRNEVLAHPALSAYLQGIWNDLLTWLQDDLGRDDSKLRARLERGAKVLGDKLLADPQMLRWINGQIEAAAPQWIDRYREDIRRYIVARVQDWNTAELTLELERNIGRDLQFVRVNGTLVGGMIGLAIHGITQWVRG